MMIANAIMKVFGTKHQRTIKRLSPIVARINALEEGLKQLSDSELQAKTAEFRARLTRGETTDDLLEEAFAVVKNACRRMVGQEVPRSPGMVRWVEVPYDVQIMGGIMLHQGGIAEMQTGEGKTLVAIMPLYLNALTGRNCQLVTVNDYLASRDSQWVGSILRWLGITVGCIQSGMTPAERREQYACDVTYGTNSEFGFDYLRDRGMATRPDAMVQRDHFFVIIDEVDSILIDEARTPLIISGPAPRSTHRYDHLQPAVAAVYRKQNAYVTSLIGEAEEMLAKPELSADDRQTALEKILMAKMGMPKHRRLLRLLEDPGLQRELEKTETLARSEQNRGAYLGLKEALYFTIDERHHDSDLSELGRRTLEPNDPESFIMPDLATGFQAIDDDDSLDADQRQQKRDELQALFDLRSEEIHNIAQLLRAYCLYERDHHYIVDANKVVIVDEFTGRAIHGRRFGDGLHQALEAKEGVTIERETRTLATITIQNYFRLYDKLAGMTGTAETEAGEFRDIYGLDVAVIPTNQPCRRVDADDRVFRTRVEKYRAIIADLKERHASGQPVLLGTVSVQVSEVLSRMLQREKIAHNVLNAKNHAREAEIVAQAGQGGAVTIATNMAGRGTDIRLGPGVEELGGLYVIGSGRHDSRRVDRQLRGRCARQGDPGLTRFYISLEDDLMRLFGSDRIAVWMQRMGMKEGEELSHPWLNRSIESAQRKVEQQHFSVRKRVLEYDDVENQQRNVIYARRHEILTHEQPRQLLFNHVYNSIYTQIESHAEENRKTGREINSEALLSWLRATFPIGFTEADVEIDILDVPDLAEQFADRVEACYLQRVSGEDLEAIARLERSMILGPHDESWQLHLTDMEQLRKGVHLQTYAQKDPLVVFKSEGFAMFQGMLEGVGEQICSNMFRSAASLEGFHKMLASQPTHEAHTILGQFAQDALPQPEPVQAETVATYHRPKAKVGRNAACPCGSGRKHKRCCAR